jgi:hypothetical protein
MRWPNDLAKRFATAGLMVGVVNAGITGNQLLADGSGQAGITRLRATCCSSPA